jgi:plasmid stabilization system protein ParE
MLVESPYLVFYEVQEHRLVILRILDGRRRITQRMVSDPD